MTRIYFIEYLTLGKWLFYVLPALVRGKLLRKITAGKVYFIDASGPGKFISRLAGGFLYRSMERLDFNLFDIKDDTGLLVYLRIAYFDAARLQKNIFQRPIFNMFRPLKTRLPTYLSRQIVFSGLHADTLVRAQFLVQLTAWKIKSETTRNSQPSPVLFLNNRIWQDEIIECGKEHGVEILFTGPGKFNFRDFFKRIGGTKAKLLQSLYYFIKRRGPIALCRQFANRKKIGNNADPVPKIAVELLSYLNLDRPELYSDVFFWQQSKLRGEDITIIYNNRRVPLKRYAWDEIKKFKMSAIAMNPYSTHVAEMPVFYHLPGIKDRRKPDRHVLPICRRQEKRWLKSQLAHYYSLCAYWHDLFRQTDAKVFISWFKYSADHCAIADAMERAGGVTAIYQRAYEEFPSPETTIASDIVFGFSGKNAEIERLSGSKIPYFVVTGYFRDHSFDLLKNESLRIRDKIKRCGAEKIIAYFDENSDSDQRWHSSHADVQKNYAFLLEKVIRNPKIGLVIKPKVPATLRKRLGPVADTLKEAENTGRCFIFEEGIPHGSYPPAAAALASDVAIHGYLYAATAAMESALAGIPTILLDQEGWHVSRLYALGTGKVVFVTWEHLWDTLTRYLKDPGSIPGFGDWSPVLNDIDPYQDGKAAERIGGYLQCLLDGFKAELSREKVLADAAEKYRSAWGKDKVISIL
ncbi:MAG: hypothetical protein WC532_02050 [Candidatus Omnitrophota bacterium]